MLNINFRNIFQERNLCKLQKQSCLPNCNSYYMYRCMYLFFYLLIYFYTLLYLFVYLSMNLFYIFLLFFLP